MSYDGLSCCNPRYYLMAPITEHADNVNMEELTSTAVEKNVEPSVGDRSDNGYCQFKIFEIIALISLFIFWKTTHVFSVEPSLYGWGPCSSRRCVC